MMNLNNLKTKRRTIDTMQKITKQKLANYVSSIFKVNTPKPIILLIPSKIKK